MLVFKLCLSFHDNNNDYGIVVPLLFLSQPFCLEEMSQFVKMLKLLDRSMVQKKKEEKEEGKPIFNEIEQVVDIWEEK